MDITRLHLLLNYYPSIGMVIGVLILLAGFWFKNQRAKKFSMKLFIALALFTFPVFVTGEMAGSIPGAYSGAHAEALNKHKSLARPSFLLIEATGALAIVGLALMRRRPEREQLALITLALFAAASMLVVLTATYFGRQVKFAGQVSTIVSSSDLHRQALKTTDGNDTEKQIWHA